MSKIGGELEQLTGLKSTFANQSGNVSELTANIRAQLGNTHWEGPAAERFRSSWGSEFEPVLRNLRSSLEECGVEVARRADAAEAAGG